MALKKIRREIELNLSNCQLKQRSTYSHGAHLLPILVLNRTIVREPVAQAPSFDLTIRALRELSKAAVVMFRPADVSSRQQNSQRVSEQTAGGYSSGKSATPCSLMDQPSAVPCSCSALTPCQSLLGEKSWEMLCIRFLAAL